MRPPADLTLEVLSPGRRRRRLAAAAAAAAAAGAAVAGTLVLTWGLTAADPAPPPAVAVAVPMPAPPLALTAPQPAPAPLPDPEPAPAAPTRFGRAALVVHAPGPMAVLLAEVDDRWYRGEPRMADNDDMEITLVRTIETASIPERYRAAVGREVIAVDADGHRCRARLGALAAVGHYLTEVAAPEDAAALRDAWSETSPSLAARLELADDESCGDIAWVMLPDSAADLAEIDSAPRPATVRSGDELESTAVGQQALAAFRSLPGYLAQQRAWLETEGARGTWDDGVYLAQIGPDDGGIVVASARVGGCGMFEASLTAAWRLENGHIGEALDIDPRRFISSVVGAADLNGDGLPELLVHEEFGSTAVLHSEAGRRWLRVAGPETPSFICPC